MNRSAACGLVMDSQVSPPATTCGSHLGVEVDSTDVVNAAFGCLGGVGLVLLGSVVVFAG